MGSGPLFYGDFVFLRAFGGSARTRRPLHVTPKWGVVFWKEKRIKARECAVLWVVGCQTYAESVLFLCVICFYRNMFLTCFYRMFYVSDRFYVSNHMFYFSNMSRFLISLFNICFEFASATYVSCFWYVSESTIFFATGGGCHGRTRWKHWHIAHFIHHVTYALLPFHTDVQAETKEEEEEEEEIY